MTGEYVDTSAFPVVILRLPSKLREEEIEAFYDAIQAFLDAQPPSARWATVVDAAALERVPSATQRRRIAERGNAQEATIDGRVVCTCVVVSSTVIRTVVRGIFWLMPSEYPRETAATVEEATRWTRQQLALANCSDGRASASE